VQHRQGREKRNTRHTHTQNILFLIDLALSSFSSLPFIIYYLLFIYLSCFLHLFPLIVESCVVAGLVVTNQVDIDISFGKICHPTLCLSGIGFVRQRLSGDGVAFLQVGDYDNNNVHQEEEERSEKEEEEEVRRRQQYDGLIYIYICVSMG
jgi:hypothetical protein